MDNKRKRIWNRSFGVKAPLIFGLILTLCLVACGTIEVGIEPSIDEESSSAVVEGSSDIEQQAVGEEQALHSEEETLTPEPASEETAEAAIAPTDEPTAAEEPTPTPLPKVTDAETSGVEATEEMGHEDVNDSQAVATLPVDTEKAIGPPLPAPVYFLNEEDSQIWRVEKDGSTVTQVTFEDAPVTDFDVSPLDGALVYVSSDELIYYSSALGGNRKLLMPAGEIFEQNRGLTEIHSFVRRPRWSPDGTRILFVRGDIYLHRDPAEPPQERVPQLWPVLYKDPLPDPVPDEDSVFDFEGPQTWYWPQSWLPDGNRILVSTHAYFALGRSDAIYNIEEDSLLPMETPRDGPCCFKVWGRESQQLLLAGNTPIISEVGLWRFDPATGDRLVLIPGETGSDLNLFAHPFEVGDRVYGFYTSTPTQGAMPFPLKPAVMVSVATDGSAEFDQLRDDYFVVGEADWLPDGSGAVITDVAGSQGGGDHDGIIRWLASDGSPPVRLPATGQMPQWGFVVNSE